MCLIIAKTVTIACSKDDRARVVEILEEERGAFSHFQAIAPSLFLSAYQATLCLPVLPFNPLLFPSSFAKARSVAARS